MRILITSLVIGLLMPFGAAAAADGPPNKSDPYMRLIDTSQPADNRATYTQEAQQEVQEWHQKLHALAVKTEAQGQKDSTAAADELDAAWTKTEAKAKELQTASAEEWANAKIAYETAYRDLVNTWDRNRPHAQ